MNVQPNLKAKTVPRPKQAVRIPKDKACMTSLQSRNRIHRAMLCRKKPRGG